MSRADTTIDDWISADEDTDDETQGDVTAEMWEPNKPECECGVPVSEFHSRREARLMVRMYGDEEENTVPACPECVPWHNAENRQHVKTIPHAIKEMSAESSIQRQPRGALAIKEASRE